ncbi:MAG: tRNA lysidine(34) synthetase TilS, partial [Pseudomonadales bacterium]
MEAITAACDGLLARFAGRILVGFSGGMDSSVLLHALVGAAASRGEPDRITAVHVDHALHPDSAHWAGHCEAFAASLGVPLHGESLDLAPGANLEARARAGRYRVFRGLLGSGDALALAHHADDQLESVLLHLFQGRGLYGMPARRPLGEGVLVRPLLALPRSSVSAYAEGFSLRWIDDPSNLDLELDRNFVRHRILPELSERFPGLPGRLQRLSSNAAATSLALEEALALTRNPLPLSVLDGLSRPVRQSVLRHWLVVQDAAAGVSDGALGDFLAQLESANDRQPSMSLGNGRVCRYRRRLYLVPEPPVLEEGYAISAPGTLSLPHGSLTLAASPEAGGEPVELAGPLRVVFIGGLAPGVTLRVRGSARRPR